jgi:hypothetical protein
LATGRVPTTANSPLTAKGDLFGYSTTQARVAVGSDGDTLVADSAATTGLRWQPTVVGGKNFLINGLFDIWQRSTDNTASTSNGTFYAAADRWQTWVGTSCNSRYQRISDADPLYSQYSYRIQRVAGVTTATNYQLSQNIETPIAKLLVGRTVTLSFRVKKGANWSDPNGAGAATIYYNNNVDGNCITQAVTNGGSVAFSPTTSFATYSLTATIPSSGVSSIMINFAWDVTGTAGAEDWLEFSAVQLEVGSVATAFSRAGGTLQGELAACQRYYFRFTGPSAYSAYGQGYYESTTGGNIDLPYPVTLRTQPSSIDFANVAVQDSGGGLAGVTALTINQSSLKTASLNFTVASGGTAHRPLRFINNNNAAGYVGLNAEL